MVSAQTVFLAFLVMPAVALAQTKRPPNIVLVVADDYGYRDIGYHGAEFATPTLDKLAAGGVKLENYYVQPICSPTRSQLMTGRYQVSIGKFFLSIVHHKIKKKNLFFKLHLLQFFLNRLVHSSTIILRQKNLVVRSFRTRTCAAVHHGLFTLACSRSTELFFKGKHVPGHTDYIISMYDN